MKAMHHVLWLGAILLAGCSTTPAASTPAGSPAGAPTATPTVVFISGLGAIPGSWNEFARGIDGFTTTFGFERPGYGNTPLAASDADGVRTDAEVAAMLDEALRKNDIRRPVVLVAHSLGAQYALRFARLHPRDVAGIVLVDPRLHEVAIACRAAGQSCTPTAPPPDMPEPMAAELRGSIALEGGPADPRAITELGDIPIVVITRNTGGSPAQLAQWQDALRSFAAAVKNGRYVVAEKSGHVIFRDEPDVVLREIRSVVENAARR